MGGGWRRWGMRQGPMTVHRLVRALLAAGPGGRGAVTCSPTQASPAGRGCSIAVPASRGKPGNWTRTPTTASPTPGPLRWSGKSLSHLLGIRVAVRRRRADCRTAGLPAGACKRECPAPARAQFRRTGAAALRVLNRCARSPPASARRWCCRRAATRWRARRRMPPPSSAPPPVRALLLPELLPPALRIVGALRSGSTRGPGTSGRNELLRFSALPAEKPSARGYRPFRTASPTRS